MDFPRMDFNFELWWLFGFALFFGLGWLAARVDIKQLLSESRQLPRSYFKGLNFLLNEQPDKAIEAFIEVVKVDPETVELHFALGSLFRRRGETERAIRMHRNLLERSDLGEEQRLHAMVELGEDCLKAGLLDRAEEMFLKLKDSPHRGSAMKSLLEIYQQEKDWVKAVEVARELQKDTGQSMQKEIANYYCELAVGEATHSRPDGAKRHLETALAAHRKCVRANMILGDVLAASGDHPGAIEAWKNIEQQNPAYLALVAQRLLDSHRALGRAGEGLTLLRGYLASFPSVDLLDVAFQSTLDSEGAEAAYKLVKEELRRSQTLLGLDKLLEAQLLVTPAERRPELEMVRTLIHSYTRRLARYLCENCGFKARQFYWHCPACGGWETYPPRRTEEFEQTP
jgi:lipopolysaccharide biosynthesis regulator YciM